jgi:hypothetical protein
MERDSFLEESKGGIWVAVLRGDVHERAAVLSSSRDRGFTLVYQNVNNHRMATLSCDVNRYTIKLTKK